MKKTLQKLIAGALVASSLFTLVACGGTGETPEKSDGGEQSEVISSTENESTTTLKIAASPSPHAEILKEAAPALAEKGIILEIVEFTGYSEQNDALDEGEVDANYFQHEEYLNKYNEERGTNLGVAGFVHYEPMGIYPGKTARLEDLAEGATIAVPNDATNEARALLLLQTHGIIKLKDGADITATVRDIVENPKNVEIVEVEAAQIPRTLEDVDFGIINGNYALLAEITDTVLVKEDDNSVAVNFANLLAVRPGEETRPEIVTVLEVLKSDEIKEFIEQKYSGSVIVVKDDEE